MTVSTNEPSRRGAELAAFINSHRRLIEESLPKHLTSDRFTRLALNCIRKTPKLQLSTPESFVGSLLTASALGLEPGVNEEAYLVPYDVKERGSGRVLRTECQLIIGYQGYAKMFWQHPMARHLAAHAVYSGDDFDYDYGTAQYLRHKPRLGPDRGEIIAYYAIAGLSNGATEFVVLTPAEVAELRNTTRRGEIPDPQHWMERKTCLRQLLKLLPKSTQIVNVAQVDGASGASLLGSGTARQILEGAPLADVEVPVEEVDLATGEVLSSQPEAATDESAVQVHGGDVVVEGSQPAPEKAPRRAPAKPPIQQVAPPAEGPDEVVEAEVVQPAPLARQVNGIRSEAARLGIQSNNGLKMTVISRVIGRNVSDVQQLTRFEAQEVTDLLVSLPDAAALKKWLEGQPSLDETPEG